MLYLLNTAYSDEWNDKTVSLKAVLFIVEQVWVDVRDVRIEHRIMRSLTWAPKQLSTWALTHATALCPRVRCRMESVGRYDVTLGVRSKLRDRLGLWPHNPDPLQHPSLIRIKSLLTMRTTMSPSSPKDCPWKTPTPLPTYGNANKRKLLFTIIFWFSSLLTTTAELNWIVYEQTLYLINKGCSWHWKRNINN